MAVSTIKQFTQLPQTYFVNTQNNTLTIYGAASRVSSQRRSFFIFANNQGGGLYFIHLFTGQNGNELSASWMFGDHPDDVLTPRIDGNDIVIDCSGTALHSAWGNGIAITNLSA